MPPAMPSAIPRAPRAPGEHSAEMPGGSLVSASGEVALQPMLGAAAVLDQVDTGVVVVDCRGNLLYANQFAVALLGLPDDARHLVGRPLLSLGVDEADGDQAQHLVR